MVAVSQNPHGAMPSHRSSFSSPQAGHMQLQHAGAQVQYAQPVSMDRGLSGWFNGVLDHIGKNPISFALSIGASAVIRGAINANLLLAFGITGGLPALAVAVGAAMVTSLVMSAVKGALGGPQRSGEDVVGNSLKAGLISGIIGGLLGTQIDADAPDLPQNDMQPWPATATSTSPYAEQYIWDVESTNGTNYELSGHYSPGIVQIDSCNTLEYGKPIFPQELLKEDLTSEWFVLPDTDGNPYQVFHRDGMQAYVDQMEERAEMHGICNPPKLAIMSHELSGAEALIADNEAYLQENGDYNPPYAIVVTSEALTGNPIMAQSMIDQEFGHVYANQNSLDGVDYQTPHERHFYSDAFALQDDNNYEGLARSFTRSALEQPALNALMGTDITIDEGTIMQPSTVARLENLMNHAATDTTLDAAERAHFEATLNELQVDLHDAGMGDTVNLAKMWEQANERAQEAAATPETPTAEHPRMQYRDTKPSWVSRLFGAEAQQQAQSGGRGH